jgi:biopolymer transport protein ExbD
MAVSLRRPANRRSSLSVVSMIDVMMILLFFFMITSSYLNLDMVPALQKSQETPATTTTAPTAVPATILIRIDVKGEAEVAGKTLAPEALSSLIKTRLTAEPLTPILLFPSGGADLQALITVMDTVTNAGATRVKVIRIEAQP